MYKFYLLGKVLLKGTLELSRFAFRIYVKNEYNKIVLLLVFKLSILFQNFTCVYMGSTDKTALGHSTNKTRLGTSTLK